MALVHQITHKKFLVSSAYGCLISSVFLLSGCAPQPKINYNETDINATANSTAIQFESLKTATAILIKKTEVYDRALSEHRALSQSVNQKDATLNTISTSHEDLSTKVLLLTNEISGLKNEIDTLKNLQKKNQTEVIPAIAPLSQPSTSVQTEPSIPHSKSNKKSNSPDQKTKKSPTRQSTKSTEPSKEKSTDGKQTDHSTTHCIPVEFTEETGKVIVRFKNTFVRTAPKPLKSTESNSVKEGEVFSYTAKNDNWYLLKSGKYISKKSVVELSTSKK